MERRYRKRGLGNVATTIVESVLAGNVENATVLEIGGGVGELHIELLKRGAARATNLELSAAYEPAARRLLTEAQLADRVERRIVDIAASHAEVEPADVVVLHRVVCCYPDYAKLLAAAADHARRQVVFSHPPRTFWSRAAFGLENLTYRLRGSEFRVFTHPPKAMLAVLAAHGMHTETVHGSFSWHVANARR